MQKNIKYLMFKILSLTLILVVLSGGIAFAQPSEPSTKSAILMEYETGQVLYGFNDNEKLKHLVEGMKRVCTEGSAKGVFDRGVYVDDEGYIVVGGPVITEFGDMFAAKATNVSKAGSYLPYSSAAANGLYYTNADAAIAKHGEANVVLK